MSQNNTIPDVQSIYQQIAETIKSLGLKADDAEVVIEQQYKNIEAMFNVSQVANDSAYAMVGRQVELFRDTSKQLLEMFAHTNLTPQERADIARKSLETALTGSRELTEIANKASEEAFVLARARVTEGLEHFRKRSV